MSGEALLSRIPPVLQNLTWLDFDPARNCTWAGRLLGQFWRDDGVEELSAGYLFLFARTCAPPAAAGLPGVTPGDVVDWDAYNFLYRNVSLVDITTEVDSACHAEFCRNLKWPGNPDLSGVGVFAAYVIQAIFTTLFMLVYIVVTVYEWHRRQTDRKRAFAAVGNNSIPFHGPAPAPAPAAAQPYHPTRLDRCVAAFWVSSFYFGVAMAVAALAIVHLEDGYEYTTFFSFLGAQFSASVLVVLWPWYRRSCTHPHLALASLSVLAVLLLVISSTYRAQFVQRWNTFELFCFVSVSSHAAVYYMLFLPLGGVPGGFAMVVAMWALRARYPVRYESMRPVLSVARWSVSLVAFGLLWASLGLLAVFRVEMDELLEADFAENKWGFGQILAIVAWVPMHVEFFRIWACESMFSYVPILVMKLTE
ncbi:hypothetical protein B0T24DRAFT_642088 [Lasiosphaeria ovina]|uniref:Uncharacterized protein n=1 Tax=Lasiosphaeria ovina TaxID=92902 RepID=A0AAE0JU92_9PEZI|nr:hypothetical protein B0T24DRAFT_642088 [Lasiosphaeria ovina]